MGANIDYTTSLIIGSCAMITGEFEKESNFILANLGAKYGSHLNQNQLAKFFGYFCLLIGLFVPLYRFFKKDERKDVEGKYFIHALSGCAIGFLSGLIVIQFFVVNFNRESVELCFMFLSCCLPLQCLKFKLLERAY
jgi:uncharacterized membrane protein YfcA